MRRLSADWIFPVSSAPLRRGILLMGDDGSVLGIEDTGGELREQAGLEYYNGILVPGLVNAHCHLELSYLYRQFAMHNKLPGFIRNIAGHTRPGAEHVMQAMREADARMWQAGIQAVGDICNNAGSLDVKKASRIRYHSFVETFDLAGGTTASRLEGALQVLREMEEAGVSSSLVPHAPYTVSADLMRAIAAKGASGRTPGVCSIHNQETESEDRFMRESKGELADLLKEIGARVDPEMHGKGEQAFAPTSSPEIILPFFEPGTNVLLVHNTFTGQADLECMKKSGREISLVLCPNANLYIENRLPEVELLANSGLNICMGTDSLASNTELSVLDEMKTLACSFPQISFGELLRWATLNGAKALGMEELGSFEVGKKPGVLLMEGMELENVRIDEKTRVRRIV